MQRYGVPVPPGRLAATPEEAAAAVRELGPPCALKAQIHAGGRGKAGGIKVARDPEEGRKLAADLLGRRLITHQTGPAGKVVRKLWVERACQIARELYVGLVIDRGAARVVCIASREGGVEIEEVARRAPEQILREPVDPALGLQPFQARKLAFALALPGPSVPAAVRALQGLYRAFVESDASLAEINPLILTAEGELLALDAKMTFDDSALFRHPEIQALQDVEEEDPLELQAGRAGISYISLDGTIGCMVNGAGLAMATMDIIKLHGGEPANFLDVGGGASREQVATAFKILLADRKVEGVLVNIFGGIMKCDVIAQGIIEAVREVAVQVPLVVRLAGTNVEMGKEILARSGLPLLAADTMEEAAQQVIAATRGGRP
ncbi:MAG: ADP-forming succinate--CoA ligase subunit beta [Deltaproteobacteria bacterium]|nr:ADP-forming succinate--CoA ligase subunit beta [Deltaproteobacteria bacterium]